LICGCGACGAWGAFGAGTGAEPPPDGFAAGRFVEKSGTFCIFFFMLEP
jgi:hypothetical protein